ncbi:tetratricopeptide repeat protein [Streptomyces nojiriensis]
MNVRGGGVGAGRNATHNAVGPHSQVFDNRQYEYHLHPAAAADEVQWPLEIGAVPTLASAFQPRAELRERIDAARSAGNAAVPAHVLTGGGGVGKSQLTCSYAAEALGDGTDLVLWAPATEVQQVITLYAQAAARVAAPGAAGEKPEDDARAFMSWLATTPRRWLVVLDDICDPSGMDGWWPVSRTGSGWVLATTRLHDARITGGGRRRVNVDVYTPGEAAAYLQARLADDDAEHLLDTAAAELAAELGHLPLALGHAAAYMINEGLSCTDYLARFTDGRRWLDQVLPPEADTEGYGRQVAATLLLSLDAAQHTEPAGLAEPALRLASLLDPAGHPQALWATPDICDYLTQHRAQAAVTPENPPDAVTSEQAQAALRTLHRYALLNCDTRREPRAVRVHALTARAAREATPPGDLRALAIADAEALLRIWPDVDQPHADLAATLRSNTAVLADHSGDHFWEPEGPLVLFRAGRSLDDAGLAAAATAYWQRLTDDAERVLGPEHPRTLAARANLGASYWQAGRTADAIALQDQVLADAERLLGPEHPQTLAARANLATSYWQAGRTIESITLEEQVLADTDRILGPDDPGTLTARANLASSYRQAGRTAEAIALQEQVLAARRSGVGPAHPQTLVAASNLAASYFQAGRTADAMTLQEQVLADAEPIFGPEHPRTLAARANLATSYLQAGRTADAVTLQKQVLADRRRVLGREHPDTLTTQANLAVAYWQAGRADESITLLEQALADRRRVLGREHPDTLTTQANLAVAYWQAGRADESITLQEQALADSERALGREHPDTLTTQANLAATYWEAGRAAESITLLEQVLGDAERLLGPEHPHTEAWRDSMLTMKHGRHRT